MAKSQERELLCTAARCVDCDSALALLVTAHEVNPDRVARRDLCHHRAASYVARRRGLSAGERQCFGAAASFELEAGGACGGIAGEISEQDLPRPANRRLERAPR